MPSIGSYLQPVLNTGIQLKDYAHASRLYADNVFALAPKAGWLYYVVFDIDPSTITDQQWANQQRVSELGMLVKAADLPKFQVQTETINQYNRSNALNPSIVFDGQSYYVAPEALAQTQRRLEELKPKGKKGGRFSKKRFV